MENKTLSSASSSPRLFFPTTTTTYLPPPTYLRPTYVRLSLSTYVNLKIVSTRVFGSKSINNDIYRF